MERDITIKFKVYEFNRVMGNDSHLALQLVKFNGWEDSFDTEQEAIDELIKADKTYEDFVILKTVHIA